VRLQVIGRRDRVPAPLRHEIEVAEFKTAKGLCLHLRIAVDYSSRDAITRAAANIGNLSSGQRQVSPELLRSMLTRALTEDAGEVDLLIRTGGEKRLSDFLLWESAYAELLFTDRMWPEFGPDDLEAAVGEFRQRERRFGGVPATASRCERQIGGMR
jgi:undecaprenyl diphosphate synthase